MTRRHRAALCFALLALPVAAARGWAAASDPEAGGRATWYAQALARGDRGLNVTYFWSKGPKMRAETVIAGHKIVTIVNGEYYYALDPIGGTGIAIRRTPEAIAADSPDRRPFGREFEALLGQGAEKIRDEEIQGASTEVYRLTNSRGRREIWVSVGELRLPVRLSIFDRATGRTQTTDYINWLRNLEIDDSFFEPDPGVALSRYEFEDYMERSSKWGPVGPVPVLFGDLLHGNRRRSE